MNVNCRFCGKEFEANDDSVEQAKGKVTCANCRIPHKGEAEFNQVYEG